MDSGVVLVTEFGVGVGGGVECAAFLALGGR